MKRSLAITKISSKLISLPCNVFQVQILGSR